MFIGTQFRIDFQSGQSASQNYSNWNFILSSNPLLTQAFHILFTWDGSYLIIIIFMIRFLSLILMHQKRYNP